MSKQLAVPQIVAKELALSARERLLSKAQAKVAYHERLRRKQVAELHDLKVKWRPSTASDCRLRIVPDESMGWHSERAMLDDVFGDTWCDADGYHNDAECLSNGGCEYNELAQEFVEAWSNGRGIFCWGGIFEVRNRVTGKWIEEDSCFGFYSTSDYAPEDEIASQLVPAACQGCEVVYGEGGEDDE